MFRKTIAGALLVAASAAAALVLRNLKNEEKEIEEDDDEIHFIRISDDDETETADELTDYSTEVQEVCAVYPYLKPGFVNEQLNCSLELNAEYPEDTLISITHQTSFTEQENAASFSEIMEAAGYICNAVTPLDITAAKKFFTEDGAILSDVLNVANQTCALQGIYKTYSIQK